MHMISSFKCKDTQELYETGANRRFASIIRVALRKLDMLSAATKVETLRVPPGNRLEQLHGTEAASGAYASMTNGAYAFAGAELTPRMLK